MIDKNTIRDLILRECDICIHLHGKIPEGTFDYRPTRGQRTTLELLQYLSYCALAGMRVTAEGSWDCWRELAEAASALSAEEFPAAMERQKQAVREYLDRLTQEEIETRMVETPVGEEMPLERALIELPLHWMVAYRMQLFLYAKQAGNEEIWTPNCWAGVDWERPTPREAGQPT